MRRLGGNKESGKDTARTADPDWYKGYSRPYGIMFIYKTGGNKKEDGNIHSYDIWLLKNPLHAMWLCFLVSGWTSATPWKQWMLCLLCFSWAQLCFTYWTVWFHQFSAFVPQILSLVFCWRGRKWVSAWNCFLGSTHHSSEHQTSNQLTTVKCFKDLMANDFHHHSMTSSNGAVPGDFCKVESRR